MSLEGFSEPTVSSAHPSNAAPPVAFSTTVMHHLLPKHPSWKPRNPTGGLSTVRQVPKSYYLCLLNLSHVYPILFIPTAYHYPGGSSQRGSLDHAQPLHGGPTSFFPSISSLLMKMGILPKCKSDPLTFLLKVLQCLPTGNKDQTRLIKNFFVWTGLSPRILDLPLLPLPSSCLSYDNSESQMNQPCSLSSWPLYSLLLSWLLLGFQIPV